MNHEAEIIKLLQRYFAAYPNSQMDAGALAFYARALAPLSIETIDAAMMMLIRTSKFFPSIAEVFQAAQSLIDYMENKRPSATEAWAEVMREARRKHLYKPWDYSCDEVQKAVAAFGKQELCTLEEDKVGIARAQFMKMYNEIVQAEKDRRRYDAVVAEIERESKPQLQGEIIALAEAKSMKEARK